MADHHPSLLIKSFSNYCLRKSTMCLVWQDQSEEREGLESKDVWPRKMPHWRWPSMSQSAR